MDTVCIDHGKKLGQDKYASCWNKEQPGTWTMLHRVACAEGLGVTVASLAGKVVRHRCDNKRCVNPRHLMLGNHADNTRDSEGKALTRVTTRVLSDQEVVTLRARRSLTGLSHQHLANELGVSRMAVTQILSGARR